ncbi:DUF4091 domain-containing protein [Paenibacillus sp. LHD-117]|uniref:DUF4091 domain-containing protein n=1 Tax=Paenibacillus sp. LHD-117 TaxID=3071412 RepID=UPI0027E20B4D|nr:DUF4091 domain-containing protein [Paenibacillus sp. LHD-117]MDQ6422977.1 DUF4091 domain-containing protein [Paenibacillus sp. LHD-117]
MTNFQFILVDSLEKVLPSKQPSSVPDDAVLTGLIGETLSFQLAYRCETESYETPGYKFHLRVKSLLRDKLLYRKVELVPSAFPCYGVWDDNYLTTEPGLLPDLLKPLQSTESIKAIPNQWRAIWVDVKLDASLIEKEYKIELSTEAQDGTKLWEHCIRIQPVKQPLPAQRLLHTEWFHADCLADYYKVPVFSEVHWAIIDNFMASAASHGINMLLTPMFTPPLDTAIGGERTTVQLIDVVKNGDEYKFDFSRFIRWIDLCKKHGITNIELSHLFTQWGAEYAPKIIAKVDGEDKQIFGWDTPATGEAYHTFLCRFLPELKSMLKQQGIFEQAWFHISDEPHDHQKETYAAAKDSIKHLLKDCRVIDALSSFDIYREGVVDKPIASIDKIQPFIDSGVKELWAYYCTVQALEVSNRFMAMPSARNRILGILLYLYQIEGFLHWSFNFYNSQYSLEPINPYIVTDAGEAFPSGDPFLVYPAPDGHAYESIRGMVLKSALYDLRALELLEMSIGRSKVEQLIHEGLSYPITFSQYPRSSEYIFQLREKVNRLIELNKS